MLEQCLARTCKSPTIPTDNLFSCHICVYEQARFLSQAGGSTVAETVRAVLKHLMTSDVALQLNWK